MNHITPFIILKIIILSFIFNILSFSLFAEGLPDDLPIPVVTKINNPSPGALFMSPFGDDVSPSGPFSNYLLILDSSGQIMKYFLVPGQEKRYLAYHFKSEPNGLFSFMTRKESQELDGSIYIADTSFNILKTFKDTINPYKRVRYYGAHHIMPNGNSLLLKYDFKYVDMSEYFPNGEPNGATLQGFVQEIDQNDNVIFQWQSMDYIPISDTYNPATPAIEYFHGNSLAYDDDDNILVSARNLCAVMKINKKTGDIVWTLGGKSNDFKFIGENEANAPTYFSYQHDIRLLDNGHITLFDNGQQHSPNYSRAVEYALDEKNMTCTMVWEHRSQPDIYSAIFGNYQKLPNGNNFINWGSSASQGEITLQELNPDGDIELEIKLPNNLVSQFTYKLPYPSCNKSGDITKFEMMQLNTYDFNDGDNRTGVSIKFDNLNAFIYNELNIKKYDCAPVFPKFNEKAPNVIPYRIVMKPSSIYEVDGELRINIKDFKISKNQEDYKVYYREKEGEGFFELLETSFENNELIAKINSVEGEFIIAKKTILMPPQAPFLYNLKDNSKPNINQKIIFSWNPRGYFDKSHIQISLDSEFNSNIIDIVVNIIDYLYSEPIIGQKQYWRVRTANESGWGEWSETRTFTPSGPNIQIKYPIGGEIWEESSYIIRWDYNVLDSINSIFKVELYRNGEFYRLLRDNLFSVKYAFKWNLPENIESDSTYQIKITAKSDTNISTISSNYFTIKKKSTDINDDKSHLSELNIMSYPNPSTNIINFEFHAPIDDNYEITLYDINGNFLNKIFNNFVKEGKHIFSLNNSDILAGVYLYKISNSTESRTKKLILNK